MRRALPAAALVLVVLSATTGITHGVWLGSWTGELPVSEALMVTDEDCREWRACSDYEGLIYDDIDIRDEMAQAEEEMAHHDDYLVIYDIKDSQWTYLLTSWRVCQYDINHSLLGCDETYQASTSSYDLAGKVDKDAAYLRVLLKTELGAEYYLRLTTIDL